MKHGADFKQMELKEHAENPIKIYLMRSKLNLPHVAGKVIMV